MSSPGAITHHARFDIPAESLRLFDATAEILLIYVCGAVRYSSKDSTMGLNTEKKPIRVLP